MSPLCPCGSLNTYSQCCEILHTHKACATTAEQLMRSRFSAFYLLAQGNTTCAKYLIDSWQPPNTINKEDELKNLRQHTHQPEPQQQWQSLNIVHVHSPTAATTATVEFVAFFTAPNIDTVQQLHEKSNFIKQDGRWFYVDGQLLPDIKLQRNDHCWCGSGKKLKKCHVTFHVKSASL